MPAASVPTALAAIGLPGQHPAALAAVAQAAPSGVSQADFRALCKSLKPPKDPNQIFNNLKARFPGASDAEISAALAQNGGHAGRAAEALDRSEAVKPPEQQLSEDKIAMAFKLFDTDGSGAISFREFKVAVESLGFLMKENMQEEDVRALYVECDTNGDGKIELDEWMAMMKNHWGNEDRGGRLAANVMSEFSQPKLTLAQQARADYQKMQKFKKVGGSGKMSEMGSEVTPRRRAGGKYADTYVNDAYVPVPRVKAGYKAKTRSSACTIL